jgi:hypothetical protein
MLADRRWHNPWETTLSLTPLADLLEQAARARRLAIAIRRDPAAPRLVHLAEELEAEIARLSRLE